MSSRNRDQVACVVSCIVSSASSVALTTLVTLFAASTLNQAPIHNQALAAAVLDLLALAALLPYTIIQFWKTTRISRWTRLRRWSVASIVMLPSLIALILSIYVIAWMHDHPNYLGRIRAAPNTQLLINLSFAMWAITLTAQAIFFTLCLRQSSLPSTIITSSETGVFNVESAYKQPREISMSVFAAPTYSRSVPQSPSLSSFTVSPIHSVRNSMTHLLRPATSKTRLVTPRKDSFSTIKDMSSIISEVSPEPVIRQEDGFETWEVEPQSVTLDPTSPTLAQSTRLETIPGSRPVSPANPLNGPFPTEPAPPESIPLPESPPLVHLHSPTLYIPHHTSPPLSATNSPTTQHTFIPPFASPHPRRPSAASTTSHDQSHIHPLFRTDSPTPPPTASPGTILTASPWGGQTLPLDSDFARGRKNSVWSSRTGYDGSRSSSPAMSLQQQSGSISRPGSSRGTAADSRLRSASFGDLREAQRSVDRARERDGDAVRRAPTPPMPELMREFLRAGSSS